MSLKILVCSQSSVTIEIATRFNGRRESYTGREASRRKLWLWTVYERSAASATFAVVSDFEV
jgi:hypothetical protein